MRDKDRERASVHTVRDQICIPICIVPLYSLTVRTIRPGNDDLRAGTSTRTTDATHRYPLLCTSINLDGSRAHPSEDRNHISTLVTAQISLTHATRTRTAHPRPRPPSLHIIAHKHTPTLRQGFRQESSCALGTRCRPHHKAISLARFRQHPHPRSLAPPPRSISLVIIIQ